MNYFLFSRVRLVKASMATGLLAGAARPSIGAECRELADRGLSYCDESQETVAPWEACVPGDLKEPHVCSRTVLIVDDRREVSSRLGNCSSERGTQIRVNLLAFSPDFDAALETGTVLDADARRRNIASY